MPAKRPQDLSQPVSDVTFQCGVCRHTFEASPNKIEDNPAPDASWHPFRYFATCPRCSYQDAGQAGWHRALMKAWVNATGPKTTEGKAATAANLIGHPTPEEALRTRFNGMKTGLHAKTATYFPSKPDGYAHCKTCDVDRGFCAEQPACVMQTRLFMTVHAAFEQRNPKLLTGIFGGMQAAMVAIVQQMLQTILADGVKIEAPQWYTDKEGVLHVAQYTDEVGEKQILKEINAHPLLKPLGEFLTRNNMSLSDLAMTPKVIEEAEESLGRLKTDDVKQEALLEFAQRQATAVQDLKELMNKARANKARDPVVIEHVRENGGSV
ncbi:hypothetical protein [Chitinimonas taiwanensis]|uniref:hypothetical protein n=1 Tax=Chitinimonas taiwanensis TaxID=240412 RepID=UPI0035B073BF